MRRKLPWPKSVIALLIVLIPFLGLGAKMGFSQDSDALEALKARASRIYAYDRQVRSLPSNRLYALSLALNFGDLKGAEMALRKLEGLSRQ
jgi:hypothetical protein